MGNIVFEFTPKQIVFEMAMPVVNVSQTTLFSTLKDVLLTNLANDDMIVYSISALKFINQVKDYYTKTALEAKDFRGITSENIASWNGKQPAL